MVGIACLLAVALPACGGAGRPAARQPNILLVTIDTLRADRIGVGVAPTVDRLAASGLRFTSARSAVPLTLPSHATIHTGLLPPEHGVRENGVGGLAATHQTIATLLKAAGYRTAAFIGAFVLDRRFGLAQGFDTYDDQIPRDPNATERLEAERPASDVVDRALAWLRTAGGESRRPNADSRLPNPLFLWIHLYDPHAPYNPPPEFRARTRTPYDGEIAFADSQVARLLDALRAAGAIDHTLIIVAGDHGEGLGDHGERTHGMLLYDSTLRVPLVIVAPGRTAATIDEAVSLSEIAPTILRAAGMTPPASMTGRDLLTVGLKPDTRTIRARSTTLRPRSRRSPLLCAHAPTRYMRAEARSRRARFPLMRRSGCARWAMSHARRRQRLPRARRIRRGRSPRGTTSRTHSPHRTRVGRRPSAR